MSSGACETSCPYMEWSMAERTATVFLPSLLQAKARGQLHLPGPHLLPIYLPQAPSFSGNPQVHRLVPSLVCNPAREDVSPAPTTCGYMESGHTGLHHQSTGSLLDVRFRSVTCPH